MNKPAKTNQKQTLERKTNANQTTSNQLNQSFSSRGSLWLNTRFPTNDCFSCSAGVRSVRRHAGGYPDRGRRLPEFWRFRNQQRNRRHISPWPPRDQLGRGSRRSVRTEPVAGEFLQQQLAAWSRILHSRDGLRGKRQPCQSNEHSG